MHRQLCLCRAYNETLTLHQYFMRTITSPFSCACRLRCVELRAAIRQLYHKDMEEYPMKAARGDSLVHGALEENSNSVNLMYHQLNDEDSTKV